MRLFRLATVLALGFAIAALSPRVFATESEDEQAIKDLVAAYAAARESRDPAAIRKLFTEDADQLVSSGVWRRGRQVLVKGMLGSSRRNPGARTLTVETVRFPAPDMAVADARYVIKGTGGAVDRRMWSTFLCLRSETGWRIAAIRNMLPAPR